MKTVGDISASTLKAATLRKKAVQDILNQMETLSAEDLTEIINIATFTGQPDPSSIKLYDPIRSAIIKKEMKPIATLREWRPFIFPGIPVPDYLHLNFNNQVFVLNASQVKTIEADLNMKLPIANKIIAESK